MRLFILITTTLLACASHDGGSTSQTPVQTPEKSPSGEAGATQTEENEMEFATTPQEPVSLTVEEKHYLLALARTTLDGSSPPQKPQSTVLDENLGAFVTLKEHENLRGCIGYIIGQGPLWREIPSLALKAAHEDPRFMPVTREEVPELSIEISVMTKLWQMKSPEEIEIGTHGLFITLGYASGILLPQVAPEFGVDRYGFLEMVCQKAGLPRNAWKDPNARIYLFAASVFGEE
jgi:AmmeMemoRadiSam system protein A